MIIDNFITLYGGCETSNQLTCSWPGALHSTSQAGRAAGAVTCDRVRGRQGGARSGKSWGAGQPAAGSGNRNSTAKPAAPALRNRISRPAKRLSSALILPAAAAARDPRAVDHVHPQWGAGLRFRSPRRLPPGPGPRCVARGAGPAARPQAGFGGGSREPFAGEPGARGPEVVSI